MLLGQSFQIKSFLDEIYINVILSLLISWLSNFLFTPQKPPSWFNSCGQGAVLQYAEQRFRIGYFSPEVTYSNLYLFKLFLFIQAKHVNILKSVLTEQSSKLQQKQQLEHELLEDVK